MYTDLDLFYSSLVIQHSIRMYPIAICSLPGSRIFFHLTS